ncbi:response regulator [Roseomonas eburnea]|uniref:histidine kinase n=1 Tax=Neoroseomonas eburnea TaxID=1346889 RepID=A0A9X9XHB7_9PROT|nr:response regulator [Neoroseomonas eburnea]
MTDPEAAAFRRLFEAEEEAGLAVLDTGGRIRFANAALTAMCGAGPAPVPGTLGAALFVAASRDAVADAIAAALAGPPAPPVVPARLADPGLPADASFEVACRPLRGEPGALMRVVDVTARRRIQAQMEEGARLQSIGQLAGGVAHDFNNLLAAISGAAEAALAREPGPETAEDLRQILDSATRGARLVKQLLAFASRQALAPRVIALGEAVDAMAPLLVRLLGARQVLKFDMARPGPLVRVDPSQLDQALLNLVVNARDAMPEGGTIRIALREVMLAREEVAQGAVIPAGDWVVLSVEDHGRGIAPDLLPRIFEPFFTTRRGAGGTGLGLSTVLGILRQSGGHVSVASAPGQGTVFRLWFPRAGGAAQAAAPAAPAEAAPTMARRVLLVEDEAPLRLLARRALEGAGHEVRVAEDAEAALEVLEGGFLPEVLVTDVTMPGEMDGLALADAMRARIAGLSVVLVSGYAEATVGDGLAGRGIRFLEKPFRMADLAAAVAEARPAAG